jgi:muramoyltetrapeptide carboxypeptidase
MASSKKIIVPPSLKKGDTIGIVCPAGYMALEKAQTCIDVLQTWGYKVRLGQTLGKAQVNYFSGNDQERLADLQTMMDDPTVNAILCGRGGYGLGRIADQLDLKKIMKQPKWVVGFSDITVLHALLLKKGLASLHAPMAAAFNDGEFNNEFVQSLKKAWLGKAAKYVAAPHPCNQTGTATAMLVGGNLSLVAHLVGTPTAFDTKGKILFLEDIGEYQYNIDRMFWQLQRSGTLNNLAGLVLGGFTDMKDTTVPFGQTMEAILHEHTRNFKFPVCFHFPVSHEKENYALKQGCRYTLTVTNKKVELKEIGS